MNGILSINPRLCKNKERDEEKWPSALSSLTLCAFLQCGKCTLVCSSL